MVAVLTPWRPATTEMITTCREGKMEIDKETHPAQPGFQSLDPCAPAPCLGDARHADRPKLAQHFAGYILKLLVIYITPLPNMRQNCTWFWSRIGSYGLKFSNIINWFVSAQCGCWMSYTSNTQVFLSFYFMYPYFEAWCVLDVPTSKVVKGIESSKTETTAYILS